MMDCRIERCSWTDVALVEIPVPAGRMLLTHSLTSGLCRVPGDPAGTFWGVGDRGPNIKPCDAVGRFGLTHLQDLDALDGAKILPLPGSGPSIGRFRLDGDTIVLEETFALRDAAGRAVTGLAVPPGGQAQIEPVFDLFGMALAPDPNGADTEGIAAMPDGTFWIAEEYGPSLLQVDRTGIVQQRWVPAGTLDGFAGLGYPVMDALPALAAARQLNRGFEGIAASNDGAHLFVAFQSPLAHPDRQAHRQSRHVRIWQLDAHDGALLAEYIYPLDGPDSFVRDTAVGEVNRSDVKVSEIVWAPGNVLLVLERVSLSTRIYRVQLDASSAADPAWCDPGSRPTLEQHTRAALREARVPLLDKTLLLSTDDHLQICGDLEGMILLSQSELLLVNDNDYGVDGAGTEFWRVRFAADIVA